MGELEHDRTMTPKLAIVIVWAVWIASWAIASVWSSRAQARADLRGQSLYWIVTGVGFAMLFGGAGLGFRGRLEQFRLWTLPEPAGWATVALAIAGFAFSWWARIHLGTLWSSTVTRKADHHIVDTGPYRIVRHPIYTGMITAAIGVALQGGTAICLVGLVLGVTGLWWKAKIEEGFLRSELGPEAYDAYRAKTPMLAPFLRFPA